MKNWFFFFCIVLSQVFFSQHVIYVSNWGNDKNSGQQKSPVYSLQTAFKLAQKNNNKAVDIKVSGGNYFLKDGLKINESISRTENNRIKVIGDSQNRPVFFGGEPIVPIKNNKTGNWVLSVAKADSLRNDKLPQILSVNGKQRMISKFPSTGFLTPLDVKYYNQRFIIKIPGELNDLLKSYNPVTIKNVYVTFFVRWTNIIRYIEDHNYKESTISFTGDNFPDYYKVESKKTNFYVSNIEKELVEGEWYYKDSKEIIYKPSLTENLSKSGVYLATSDGAITITGSPNKKVSFLEFENIEFNTFGRGFGKSGYFPYQAAANIDAVIQLRYASNIIFKNIKVENISTTGVWIKEGCNDVKISESDFINLGGGAIKVGIPNINSNTSLTKNIIIVNNRILKGGQQYPDAAALLILDSPLNTISHNDISDFSYTGISVGWVWGYGKSSAHDNTISYNHIHNIGKGILDDMGGIYTLGVSTGTTIENNVIHNVKSREYGGWGIYTDEGSSGILIKNNLVYNCSSSGYHHHYGKDNIIENNIFAFNLDAELEATRIENHLSFIFKDNIIVHKDENFYKNQWSDVRKNEQNNIYYFVNNNKTKLKKDLNSHIINPLLKTEKFYYSVMNKDIFKLTNFKQIDFSTVGKYK